MNNDIRVIVNNLIELIKPGLENIAEYSNRSKEVYSHDWTSQTRASKEVGISQARISILIRDHKINSYTDQKLVSRSELAYYIANKKK